MFRYKIFFNNVASNCLTGIAVAGGSMLQTLYGMTMLQNGSTFDLIFLALLGLVFCCCYITFCKQKLMGYDKQQRQFILCQWQHFGWHVLQSYPCSQFSHVAAEHIYQHGKAQFGRVYLLDKNEQSLHIVRVWPYKDSLNQTQIIQNKIAKISGLMIQPLKEHDLAIAQFRPKNADGYTLAPPETINNIVLLGRVVYALILLSACYGLSFFLNEQTLPIIGSLMLFFLIYVLSGSLKTWRLWHNQQTSSIIPQTFTRNPAARQSGKFTVCSRNKYIVLMLLTVLITLTFSRNAKSIVSITVILLVLVGLALLWHNISQTRQLIYRAENDELTICKLTPFLTWQPENVYPASHFIGISIELGELWLIGKNEQADIYLGKSSGLTESRTERTYRVAKQIHQATGLPILVRKDIQEA